MTEQHDTPQRREYRRPAEPEVVSSVPEAANGYAGIGQDFSFYASQLG